MNPNDAETIHRQRSILAQLGEQHGFHVTLPHSDKDWIWLELYHPQRQLRIAIEWADDLPTGCQLHAYRKADNLGTINVRSKRTLRAAITEPAWFDAAYNLRDADVEAA